MSKKIILVFFVFICNCFQVALAQETVVKKDTSQVYTTIKQYSKKNKFTRLMHKLIFRSPVLEKKAIKEVQKNYNISPLHLRHVLH